jgi:archaellum component FlaG (FlaF/FlaG flagellin family)
MSLTKQTITDKIEVVANGIIQVRQSIQVLEDGNILSESYNRFVLNPGDSLESQDPTVVAVANAVWTPAVISAYQAIVASSLPKTGN